MKRHNRDTLSRARIVAAACMELIAGLALLFGSPSAPAAVLPLVKSGRWKIVDYVLSPDGRKLVELVRVWNKGGHSMDVVVRDLNDTARRADIVFRKSNISSVKWLNDHVIAFVSSGVESTIFMENITNDRVTVLFKAHKNIDHLSPEYNGNLLAYSYVTDKVFPNKTNAVSVKVTDDVAVVNLVLRKRHRAPYDMLWHVGIIRWSADGGTALGRWRWRWTAFRPKMVWINGRLMVLWHGRTGNQSFIVDASGGKRVNYGVPGNFTYFVRARNHRIVAISTMSRSLEGGGKPLRVYVRDSAGRVHSVLSESRASPVRAWFGSGNALIVQVARVGGSPSNSADRAKRSYLTGLVKVDWRNGRILKSYGWRHGTLGGWAHVCSVDRAGNRAVCVAQTLRDPPKLVMIDLRAGVVSKLGYLQSKARRLDFRFRSLKVRNQFGQMSSGFLALPKGWRAHAVPLAVMTYGFDRRYSRYAQWITSYPVAGLVHSGIAVLLLNLPHMAPWPRGDFAAARREVLQEPLSTVANAVPAVGRAGVKVTRAMIMGWSWGGLVAAFAIQDLHQFVAAQVGDPQEWTISSFALGSVMWRQFLERELGGPPVRRYIDRYLAFDPVSDGKPAEGPILFEFVSGNVSEGQFLEEWRAVGTDVEAFAYRNSIHYLNVPAEARISRKRNLDWAKLNLLGPQSVSAAELRRVGLTVPVKGWWSGGGIRCAECR